MIRLTIGLLVAVVLAGCAGEDAAAPQHGQSTPAEAAESASVEPDRTPTASATPRPRRVRPADGRPAVAMAAVRRLAGTIGPRPGTSLAYFRAARWVERELVGHGWEVRREGFRTPGGVSWGVRVAGGRSVNLVATRGDVRPGRPWLLLGAHLDTVPRAPGAEDNASGVGSLLAVAEATAVRRTRLPVVLVAFGSEEPRGPTDADHHYGSRAYVDSLSPAQRRTLRGMVSLDRVGVGDVLPVGTAGPQNRVSDQLLAAARRADVPTRFESGQRSSDHWSFARAGLPAARLGSTPYAGYHSPDDVPSVVTRGQLARTIRTALSWLAG